MQWIHQNLSLAVATVSKLDFCLNTFRIGILRFSHLNLKWKFFTKSKPFQRIFHLFCTYFQCCFCKINVIRIDQCILQIHRRIFVKRCHIIGSPGSILLPAQTFRPVIFCRIDRTRFQTNSCYNRLQCGTWTPHLPEPIIQRLILILIQCCPSFIRQS